MKNKKIVATVVMMVIFVGMVFAEVSLSVGPAYTNYFIRNKIDGEKLSQSITKGISGSFESAKTEKNNAAGISLDLHGSFLYAMLQVAFPTKTHSDIFTTNSKALKGGAFILDSQLGAGWTFFNKSRFNLFLGGGLGLNAFHYSQEVNLAGVQYSYKTIDVMMGVGANILASFYFTQNIGIFAGVADTLYFAPLSFTKTFKVGGKEYSYKQKDKIRSEVLANSLNLKLGIAFKF